MDHHDVPRTGHRRRGWTVRALAGTVLPGAVLLGAVLTGVVPPAGELPSPAVREASTADPVPPTGVVATGADRTLGITWTASTEAFISGYRVYLDGTLAASPTGTSATVSGLVNGRTYTVTVTTVTSLLGTTSEGTTASSPVPGTPRDAVAPAAPAGVDAVRGDGQVTVSWTANSADADADGYRVLRDGVPVSGLLDGRGTTGYTDTGLVNDRPYAYTVQTHDTSGNWSVSSAPAVSATPTDLTAPAAPTGPATTRGDGQVDLVWPANAEPDVVAYRVLRDGVQVASVSGTSHTDPGLVNDQPYAYTLVAVDGHGNASPPSAPAVSATPTDLTAPAAPTGLAASPGNGEVSLSWTANTEPDVASYRVLRDGAQVATVTDTDHLDSGLVNDRAYAYSLVAVDRHGNASPAAAPAVSATPTDLPPAAPTGVGATPGSGSATVRWAAAPERDVVGHRVLAEDGSVLATTTGPATQATVSGLVDGTTYRLTVVAVDAAGQVSPASSSVAVIPAAAGVPVQGAGESGGLAVSRDGRFLVVGTRARLEPADTNTAYELYLLDRTAGTARRIAPLPASATGATDPTNGSAPAISDDGRHVALATTAALVPADTNRLADVYRLDTTTGTWSLVSVPRATGAVSATTPGTLLQPGPSVYATSPAVAVSADGDLVLFYSARPDLVAGDTNAAVDVFAKRMSDGVVTRVSATATGGNLPRTATGPALALTPDGRFALFPATSTTGPVVLYRKTLSGAGAGAAVVVSSVTTSGRTTEFGVFRDTGDVALSDDGRYVALVTSAKLGTATPAANWGTGLAYRVDTATGSVLPLGNGQTTVWEHQVALDPTGRYGFFATTAAQLPDDGNGHTDHLRRDLDGGVAGPLVLVTADADGRATTGPLGSITTSEYGRLTALTGDQVLVSTSQALVPADTNRLRDVYTKDLLTGAVGSPLG